MANTTISPNMQLPVPVTGEDAGPDYADNVNNCLTLIDQHDHSPGYGVQITPAGMNINSDLPLSSNNLTLVRSVRFSAQASPLVTAADLGCLYEAGVDLYYNDGLGNQVRITQSGGVAGSPGSIANLTSPASASYVSANETFVWQSAASTPANMDGASYILRNLVANSKGLTLSPPNAMASNYSITLPSLPASTLPLSIGSSGTMSAAQITISQLDTSTQARILTAPTVQKFLSGSGTYTTPTSPVSPVYIRVRMVGGGGGGAGAGSTGATNGGDGGNTTFGATLVAGGATGGGNGNTGGSHGGNGGTVTLGAIAGSAFVGGTGNGALRSSSDQIAGGAGASSPFGGAGGVSNMSAGASSPGKAAASNTGSGGSGGVASGTSPGAGGGGAGGYIDAIIPSPSATYAYAVGAGGTAGTGGAGAGSGGGGAGGSGIIIVEEFY